MKIKKYIFWFFLIIFLMILFIGIYAYMPSLFISSNYKDEYIRIYDLCIESGGDKDMSGDLINSYYDRFSKEKLIYLTNDKCIESSIECAEKNIILANQLAMAIPQMIGNNRDFRRAFRLAKDNLLVADTVLDNDLAIMASAELLSSVAIKNGYPEYIYDYQGNGESIYTCDQVVNVLFSGIANRLIYSGNFSDGYYISAELLKKEYQR